MLMPAAPEGLDPFIAHLPVAQQLGRKTAAQLNPALIQESTQPLHRCLLWPGEAALLREQPVDLRLGDHPRTQGLKKKLAQRHAFCNELVTSCLDASWSASRLPRGSG